MWKPTHQRSYQVSVSKGRVLLNFPAVPGKAYLMDEANVCAGLRGPRLGGSGVTFAFGVKKSQPDRSLPGDCTGTSLFYSKDGGDKSRRGVLRAHSFEKLNRRRRARAKGETNERTVAAERNPGARNEVFRGGLLLSPPKLLTPIARGRDHEIRDEVHSYSLRRGVHRACGQAWSRSRTLIANWSFNANERHHGCRFGWWKHRDAAHRHLRMAFTAALGGGGIVG